MPAISSDTVDAATTFVPYQPVWRDRLVAAYKTVFGQSPAHREDFSDEQVRTTIHNMADLFLAVDGETIRGFTGGTPLADHHDADLRALLDLRQAKLEAEPAYFVDELGILPGIQRDGLGGRLFAHLVEAAMARGFRLILLQTTLHQLNPATSFYTKRGYRVLLDDRGMPLARVARQKRLDDRPIEDIRLQMYRIYA